MAMSGIIADSGAIDAKKLDFKQYIDDIWRFAMENSDEHLKTAQKAVSKDSKIGATVGRIRKNGSKTGIEKKCSIYFDFGIVFFTNGGVCYR